MSGSDQQTEELVEWVKSCKYDLGKFIREGFKWGEGQLSESDGPDDWQLEYLDEFSQQLKIKEKEGGPVRMAVASGHGIGKSALVSWIVLAYMSTRPDALITVTANTERQLKYKTWRELAKWWKMCRTREWFKWERESFRHVEQPETWFAAAVPWSINNSEAFAGQHEKYTMVIMDEASGIENIIWEVVSGALTTAGAAHLAFGNPTRASGKFYDCFHTQNHRWITRNIDARSAKMADQVYLQELVDDFEEDSDYVRVRVLGQFPRQASHQLISTKWVRDAMERDLPKEEYDSAPLMIGVDIARFGDDQSCIVWRKGPKVLNYEYHRQRDILHMSRVVAAHIERAQQEGEHFNVFVDENGMGSGVVDNLKAFGHDVIGVMTQRPPKNTRVYLNMRIELWDAMRAWFEKADIPNNDRIGEQFTQPEYHFQDRSGKMLLESKDMMRKRGLPSPDFADALAMTFLLPGEMSPRLSEDEWLRQLRGEVEAERYRDEITGY